MNEEKIIKKLSGYDDFKCIADNSLVVKDGILI